MPYLGRKYLGFRYIVYWKQSKFYKKITLALTEASAEGRTFLQTPIYKTGLLYITKIGS